MKSYEGELKIIFGSLGFAFIPVFVLTGSELSVPSLLFGRLIVAVLFLYFLLENRNSIYGFIKKRFFLLTIWALVMLGSMACYFFSISLSGMGISAAILGTQPLFIVLLAIILSVRFSKAFLFNSIPFIARREEEGIGDRREEIGGRTRKRILFFYLLSSISYLLLPPISSISSHRTRLRGLQYSDVFRRFLRLLSIFRAARA